MEEIKKDFKDIFSSKELSDFVKKYKLMKEEVKGNPMIYANYYKDFDDFGVKVVHRWYDGSKPFSIRPDIEVVEIEIKDKNKKIVHTDQKKREEKS